MRRKKLWIAVCVAAMMMTGCGSGSNETNNSAEELKTAKAETASVQTNYDQLQKDYSSLDAQYQELNTKYENLNADYTDKDSEYEKLKSEYDDYKKEMKPYETLKAEEAKAKVKELKSKKLTEAAQKELTKLWSAEGLVQGTTRKDYKAAAAKVEKVTDAKEKEAFQATLASIDAALTEQENEAAAKEAQGYETGITYDQLARTPDDYLGQKVKFSGKVVQVIEDTDTTQIRLSVDGNYDTILLGEYDKSITSSRVLEDDYITISGMSTGTISYKSTLGGTITIPGVYIQKIEQ